uniref:Uncharacterized protein n=1 Tax=Strongyloides venezuelensis TaxID=75913 RepID=A0A0K0F9T9_STRVS
MIPLNSIVSIKIGDEEMKNMLLSLLPEELIEFYESLTAREKKLLDGMYGSREKYIQDHETNRIFELVYPKLLQKIVNIYSIMREKIEKLSNEPRAFFYEMMKISKEMRLGESGNYKSIKDFVKLFSVKFHKLSLSAKGELVTEYPLMKILSNKEYYDKMINEWLKEEENLLKFKRILRFLFLIS